MREEHKINGNKLGLQQVILSRLQENHQQLQEHRRPERLDLERPVWKFYHHHYQITIIIIIKIIIMLHHLFQHIHCHHQSILTITKKNNNRLKPDNTRRR